MRLRYTLFVAVALMVGGLVLPNSVLAQDVPTPRDVPRAADEPVDPGKVAAPDAENIRDVIAQVTEASVTKRGLDDLVERFVDADRNRLGESPVIEGTNEQLDGIIELFRKNWQTKYNQEFDIQDEDTLYNESFVMIIQGEIGDAARLAGERQSGIAPGEQPAAPPGPEADKPLGGETNREPGRNVATCFVQSSHGLPEVTVPMIHELPDAWRIDIPESYSAEQLRDNLATCLTKLNENTDQWPADPNDAYRKVSHKVLMVVMNVDQDRPSLGIEKEKPMPDRPGGLGQDR